MKGVIMKPISTIQELEQLEFELIPEDEFWNTGEQKELLIHKVHVYPADSKKVNNMKRGYKYDKLEYVYLNGNYTKSLEEARKYNLTSYGGYCPVTNNCLHFVRNMLRKANVKTSFVQNVILENDTIIPADFYQALATADALNKIYSYVLYYAYFSNRYKEYPYHHPRR